MKRRHLLRFSPLALLGLKGCSPSSPHSANNTPRVSAPPNQSYRPPAYAGPNLRNPTLNLPANQLGSTITHNSGLGNLPHVAMTFDDGPHPTNTPRLLDMLRARNIRATFYVIGRNVDRYPHIARRIVAEGHEIGNHTYTHRKLTTLSDAQLRQEMEKTNASIARATGVRCRTMRPPYGALNQRQRGLVFSEYGLPTILWSVDPEDWRRPGPAVVTSRILQGTRNGAIILAHDLHAPTVTAMPGTFDGLLRKGFQFITVSQLLTAKARV